MNALHKSLYLLLSLAILGCTSSTDEKSESIDIHTPVNLSESAAPLSDEFGDYWYQGEAELTSYTLEQARYGELHQGEAVLIFVTEDFSKEKHVKLDYPQQAGDDKVNILKLNATKTFNTGIYPYSMMSSVFTPIQGSSFPRTLKVTTTSQEWCGHSFTQVNMNKDKYNIQAFSYFESEGDQQMKLEKGMLEDEVWTAIRLDPDLLPTGTVDMIPGTMYQRLGHIDFDVHKVNASLEENEDELMTYTLSYPKLSRTLSIHFNKEFPHEIDGWEETTSRRGQQLTTRASLNKRIMLDYWSKNGVADLPLRKELGLD